MARLLLVEDNEENRDMLSRRLRRKGYDVRIAVDGGEGVTLARAETFDLIVMDMSLPVLDGWEATRRLKADEATRPVSGYRRCHVRRPRKPYRRLQITIPNRSSSTDCLWSRRSRGPDHAR